MSSRFRHYHNGVLWGLLLFLNVPMETAAAGQVVRLGWQVPWATQGQLVMGLKYTNIPQLTDVQVEFVGFSYGGPLNRAALSGDVDILLTADQPALVLMSRSDHFRIVSRMMYNRVCLYVPPKSSIRALADLRGKKLMGPVGAAAERVAMAAIIEAGIPLREVTTGSLDMAQQSALLSTAEEGQPWRGVDALYGFDPLPAIFENKGQARILHCGKVVSLVVASTDMIDQRSEELQKFLRAFALSWSYFSLHPQRVNQWFAQEAKLDVGDDVLDNAASIEPNRWVKDPAEIRLTFTHDDLYVLQQALEFLASKGIISRIYDPNKRLSLEPLNKALVGYDLATEVNKVTAKK